MIEQTHQIRPNNGREIHTFKITSLGIEEFEKLMVKYMQITKITDMSNAPSVSKRKPLTEEEFQREFDYWRAEKVLQQMLKKGFISKMEFHKIMDLNRESFSSKLEKALIIIVPMILGGLIGWFIPVIADWLLNLPVVPWEKFIEFIASLNSLWISIIASIIGIIAGILLTLTIFDESLEVTITYEKLHLKLGDKVDTLEKKIFPLFI